MMRVAAKPDFFAQKSFFEKMMAGSNPAIIYAHVMHTSVSDLKYGTAP
jgi:hypothetical protein